MTNKHKELCPNCDKEIEIKEHTEHKTINIYGLDVSYTDRFYKCPYCSAEWSASGHDFAYEIYLAAYIKYGNGFLKRADKLSKEIIERLKKDAPDGTNGQTLDTGMEEGSQGPLS